MASKKQLSADADAFVPAPTNNDETIPVAPAAVEDQRAVVADKLRRLQHAQRAQLKAMLPKLPEGPAKLQLKKKIWAIEKELFPKEAAAPPPRRAIEAVAAEAEADRRRKEEMRAQIREEKTDGSVERELLVKLHQNG